MQDAMESIGSPKAYRKRVEFTSTMKQEIKRVCDQVVEARQIRRGKCEKHFETDEEDNCYMDKKKESQHSFNETESE